MRTVRVETAAVPRRSTLELVIMELPTIGDFLMVDVIVLLGLVMVAAAGYTIPAVVAGIAYSIYMMWRNSISERPFRLYPMLRYALGLRPSMKRRPTAEFADLPLDPVKTNQELDISVSVKSSGCVKVEDEDPEKMLAKIITTLEGKNPPKPEEVPKRKKTHLRVAVECTHSACSTHRSSTHGMHDSHASCTSHVQHTPSTRTPAVRTPPTHTPHTPAQPPTPSSKREHTGKKPGKVEFKARAKRDAP